MQFDVREVARLFHVDESQVTRWINEQNLPAKQVSGKFCLNRAEVVEWATLQGIDISAEALREMLGIADEDGLSEAIKRGGVYRDLDASDKDAALHAVVDALPLPAGFDRSMLIDLLLARERLGATAMGNGVAVPHPRHPVILPVGRPVVAVCFLKRAVEFGEAEKGPVDTLFLLVCPTARTHLSVLARLSCALRDSRFLEAIRSRASSETIVHEADRVEALNLLAKSPIAENGTPSGEHTALKN